MFSETALIIDFNNYRQGYITVSIFGSAPNGTIYLHMSSAFKICCIKSAGPLAGVNEEGRNQNLLVA